MKKILLFVLFFINITYFCFAQDERIKKAQAIEIAYLTKEIGLTPEEAQKFWPVFNNYREEIKLIKQQHRTDVVALEEKIVNIRKKYKVEFRKVLPDDRRVNKVFAAEGQFKNMLQNELEKRKNTNADKPRGKNKF